MKEEDYATNKNNLPLPTKSFYFQIPESYGAFILTILSKSNIPYKVGDPEAFGIDAALESVIEKWLYENKIPRPRLSKNVQEKIITLIEKAKSIIARY
jgi:hypothetical protein